MSRRYMAASGSRIALSDARRTPGSATRSGGGAGALLGSGSGTLASGGASGSESGAQISAEVDSATALAASGVDTPSARDSDGGF